MKIANNLGIKRYKTRVATVPCPQNILANEVRRLEVKKIETPSLIGRELRHNTTKTGYRSEYAQINLQ